MEIPTLMVQKIANRHGRLRRLHALNAPKMIIDDQSELLLKALDEIEAYAIEHGVIATQEEIAQADAELDEQIASLLPQIQRVLHLDDSYEAESVAFELLHHWNFEVREPTRDEIFLAHERFKQEREESGL